MLMQHMLTSHAFAVFQAGYFACGCADCMCSLLPFALPIWGCAAAIGRTPVMRHDPGQCAITFALWHTQFTHGPCCMLCCTLPETVNLIRSDFVCLLLLIAWEYVCCSCSAGCAQVCLSCLHGLVPLWDFWSSWFGSDWVAGLLGCAFAWWMTSAVARDCKSAAYFPHPPLGAHMFIVLSMNMLQLLL